MSSRLTSEYLLRCDKKRLCNNGTKAVRNSPDRTIILSKVTCVYETVVTFGEAKHLVKGPVVNKSRSGARALHKQSITNTYKIYQLCSFKRKSRDCIKYSYILYTSATLLLQKGSSFLRTCKESLIFLVLSI